ncbi:MAG: hypothetical protein JWO38_6515 [Gemmataceae bacterium]|nr:hypothetical protein [Gemmataceae bacterium]
MDITAFVNSKPRSEFVLTDHLPADARFGEYNADADRPKR